MKKAKWIFQIVLFISVILILNYYKGESSQIIAKIESEHAETEKNTTTNLRKPIEPFELIDQNGEKFTEKDLENKKAIINFFFTSCNGPCPALMAKVNAFFNKYPDLTFISISVDPTTDTPEKLKEYSKNFDVDGKRWKLLTGDIKVIEHLSEKELKLGIDENLTHSTKLIMINDKRVVGYTSSDEAEINFK